MNSIIRIAAMSLVVFLAGCAFENNVPSAPVEGAAGVHGTVYGGNQPVVGTSLQLYAVGATGYGSASTPLFTSPITSNSSGSFTFSSYTCPTSSTLVYLTATGGNPGLSGSNPQLALIAALGQCGNLNSNTNIVINELTTVAAVWPLAPFMVDLTHIGSSSTNAAGIKNAFISAAELANFSTGGSGTVPANVTLPTTEIDTIADILASCVNTTGGTGGDTTNCGKLFSATKVGSIYPTNTAAAALVMAQNPGLNVSTLFGLATADSSFEPTLSQAPNDWTITVTYYNSALSTGSGYVNLAIDASQNVWVSYGAPASHCQYCGTINALFEYGQDFTLLSPTAGYTDASLNGPYAIAFDLTGNVWVPNVNTTTLTEFSSNGSFVKTVSGGGMYGPGVVAVDKSNNIWVANFANVSGVTYTGTSEFTNAGVALSPTAGYAGGGAGYSQNGVATDPSGNAWVAATQGLAELGPGGTAISPSATYGTCGNSIALDGSGNVWCNDTTNYSTYASSLLKYNSSGQEISTTAGYTGGGLSGSVGYIAIDGLGNVWAPNVPFGYTGVYDGGALSEFSNSGVAISPSTGYVSNSRGTSNLAIDSSGNVWFVQIGYLYKVIGVAAPVVTPISVATKNSQLGSRP